MHDEKADQQVFLSVNFGRGFEHQLPHLYSQVGVGAIVVLKFVSSVGYFSGFASTYVEVQREAVLEVAI